VSALAPKTATSRPVLVVDDDCDVRDSVKDVLQDAGFSAVCVKNGEEALSYLRSQPTPRAVLLDLFMPVMSGWEFVRRVRASSSFGTVPIVVITAGEPHWGYPSSLVLRKPLEPEQLVRVLSELSES
jgi:CheY-like chemotaxis protein